MKILFRCCLALFAISLVGCGSDKTPEVKFTLSNWFNGNLVDIRLDEENGVEIPYRDGHYEIEVPATGIVFFKSLDLLTMPHSETVAYEGGSSVPQPVEHHTKLNPDRNYWWPIGQTSLRDSKSSKTTRMIYRIAKPTEQAPEDVFAVADAL